MLFWTILIIICILFAIAHKNYRKNIAFKIFVLAILSILVVIALLCSACGFVGIIFASTNFHRESFSLIIIALVSIILGTLVVYKLSNFMLKIFKNKE